MEAHWISWPRKLSSPAGGRSDLWAWSLNSQIILGCPASSWSWIVPFGKCSFSHFMFFKDSATNSYVNNLWRDFSGLFVHRLMNDWYKYHSRAQSGVTKQTKTSVRMPCSTWVGRETQLSVLALSILFWNEYLSIELRKPWWQRENVYLITIVDSKKAN